MSDPTSAFLADRFGFTPSQSRTIAVIVTGGGKKVAARERGISATSVKRHLAAAFETTGAHTQSELTAIAWRAWSMRTETEPA